MPLAADAAPIESALTEHDGAELLDRSDTAIAAQLQTTPSRVRSLRFRWEQRALKTLDVDAFVSRIVPHAVPGASDSDVIVRVDSVFVMDRLIDEIRSRRYLVRRELTSGHVRVNVVDLFMTLHALGGMDDARVAAWREELNAIAVKGKWNTLRTRLAALGAATSHVVDLSELIGGIRGLLAAAGGTS